MQLLKSLQIGKIFIPLINTPNINNDLKFSQGSTSIVCLMVVEEGGLCTKKRASKEAQNHK